MGILSQIDAELQKDLLNFVMEQDEKAKKNGKVVFGDYLLNDLLKMLISGKCKITGTVTDNEKGKLYVEYSFKDGAENG